jgi:hypothetical protein
MHQIALDMLIIPASFAIDVIGSHTDMGQALRIETFCTLPGVLLRGPTAERQSCASEQPVIWLLEPQVWCFTNQSIPHLFQSQGTSLHRSIPPSNAARHLFLPLLEVRMLPKTRTCLAQ